MNFLRKSYCLVRRDRIFHLNSCKFICNLSKTSVDNAIEGHFGNRLSPLLWPQLKPRPRPRPRCMSSSIPGLGLRQVDPQNFEQSERNSSVTSRPRRNEESTKDEAIEHLQKRRLKELNWKIARGYSVPKVMVAIFVDDMRHLEKSGDRQAVLELGLLLLRCCGDVMCCEAPSDRVQLAHHIVSTMQQLGVPMTVEHYNQLLRSYAENGHRVEPSAFLGTMTSAPDRETYQTLLWCVDEPDRALELIGRMKDADVPVSEPVFNALVYVHARTGDLASAKSVFETMRSTQLLPSSHTYTAMLRGLAERGDIARMQSAFQEATLTGAALSQNQVLSVIKSLGAAGQEASIPLVLPWLSEVDVQGSIALQNIITHFVWAGYTEAVTLLIGKVPGEESLRFQEYILREVVSAGWPVKSVLSLCNLLLDGNPLALSQATFAALRQAKTDLALALFEAMKEAGTPIRAHFYWPLLIAARKKGEQELLRLVEHSRTMGVPPDHHMLTTHVLRFVSLEAPTVLLRRLQDLGFGLTEVLTPVMSVLISDGRLEAAHQLCGAHPARLECEHLIPPLVTALLSNARLSSVIDLLKVFVQSGEQPDDWVGRFLLHLLTNQKVPIKPDHMAIIIKGLSDAGLRCSAPVVEVISRHCSTQQPDGELAWYVALCGMVDPEQAPVSNRLLNHYLRTPQTMDLKELECHLGELRAKKMNDRGVLRRLLMKYCQMGNVKAVEETKQELESSGHKFSRGMKAGLFDFYVKTKQLVQAKSFYDQLTQESDFVLDEFKALDYATLLIFQHQTEEAMLVLDNMSKQKIEGGPNISKNCWNLLVCTSRRGQPEDTRKMFDCLVERGFCTVSNRLLGPLIKAYLFREDLEGAVREFSWCVSTYQFTPLMYDLMCHLVSKAPEEEATDSTSDQARKLIEQVFAAGARVHNQERIMSSFVVALAQMDKVKWLAKTVKESGERINYLQLTKQCQRLVDQDQPKPIENLIEVFKKDTAFNLAPLFTFLLEIYCRHGDTQGALDLWSRMQETGCRPNSLFQVTFRGLLKSHNIEIPATFQ